GRMPLEDSAQRTAERDRDQRDREEPGVEKRRGRIRAEAEQPQWESRGQIEERRLLGFFVGNRSRGLRRRRGRPKDIEATGPGPVGRTADFRAGAWVRQDGADDFRLDPLPLEGDRPRLAREVPD